MGVNKKLNHEDLKQYVTADLEAKIASESAALKKLTFNHAVSPIDNPAHIRVKRRDIARMKTELNNRKAAAKA